MPIRFFLLILVLFQFSCVSDRAARQTANTPEELTHFRLFFGSDVVVPKQKLSADELIYYQNQCHIQMVDKLLNFSERLRQIKNFSGKNIQVTQATRGTYFKLLAPKEFQHFNFTVTDSNGMNYSGHMYVYVNPATQIRTSGANLETYKLGCTFEDTKKELILKDPIYEPAILKDSNGNKVFAYSCAEKMIHGKNIDERCEVL